MTISEVSKKYDISTDTLRWYEKIGLLRNINRKDNGLRDYTEENCRSIEFVKCMRSAGVSIEFLTQYIDLVSRGNSTIEKRKELLVLQKEIIEKKIQESQDALEKLKYKIENYDQIFKKYEPNNK